MRSSRERALVVCLLAPVGCADFLDGGRDREHSEVAAAELELRPEAPRASLPLRLSLASAEAQHLDLLQLVVAPALADEGGAVVSFTLREDGALIAEATTGGAESPDLLFDVELGDELPVDSVFCLGADLVSEDASVTGKLMAIVIWFTEHDVEPEFEFLPGPCE